MSFIPMGIWQQTPGLTVGLYIWKGIIPVLLGNLVGGGLFVGAYMWYFFLQGQNTVIDGVEYDAPPPALLGATGGMLNLSKKERTPDEETLRETPGTNSDKEN